MNSKMTPERKTATTTTRMVEIAFCELTSSGYLTAKYAGIDATDYGGVLSSSSIYIHTGHMDFVFAKE
jgi:hypothetical protein